LPHPADSKTKTRKPPCNVLAAVLFQFYFNCASTAGCPTSAGALWCCWWFWRQRRRRR